MVDWGPIETTPYPGETGGTPAVITGTEGGLDAPGVILPESAVQLVEADGTHVAWLATAKGWGFRRSKADPGSGSVRLKKTDPSAADLVFPRQLRFFDRGVLRQRALIEPRSDKTISPSEESGEDVEVTGPGALALTARGRVDPLALNLKPKQTSVRFTPFHPDYDDSGFDPCEDVGDFDRPTDWPGGGTNIAGTSGTHTSAPEGSVYFRDPSAGFTLGSEQTVAFLWHVDNSGKLFLDGGEIDDLSGLDQQHFLKTHEKRLVLSAGVHRVSAYGFNQPAESGDNPIALRIVVRAIDGNGQLGSILHETGTDWVAYEYPLDRPPELPYPGWTVGQILNWLLDRWEDRTGLTFARSFTDTTDSASEDWPILHDFTAPVGSLFDTLRSLSEAHCDLDWGPEDDELHAWVKDTRGSDLTGSVSLPAGYDDAALGCLLELSHQAEPPLVTSALIEWRDGYVLVEDDGAPVVVERKVDVPMVDTASSAEMIGEDALAVFGVERVQGSGRLRPRDDTQRPGLGFDVADTIDAPDRTLALVAQVVQSYTHTVDQDGNIAWSVEFGDLMFDREERFGHWLAGIGNGSLGGRTFQTTPYREEVTSPPEVRKRDPLVFHHLASDATGESDPFPIDDYQTIQAVTVQIPGGEGGTFDLNVNGSTVDTFVVSAAVTDPVTEAGLSHKLSPGDWLSVDSADAVAYVVVVRPV